MEVEPVGGEALIQTGKRNRELRSAPRQSGRRLDHGIALDDYDEGKRIAYSWSQQMSALPASFFIRDFRIDIFLSSVTLKMTEYLRLIGPEVFYEQNHGGGSCQAY